MKRAASLFTATVLALSFGAGCYKTQYQLTPPAGMARPGPQHMHLGLLGFIELSSPIDLAAECPGGGAVMIDERVGVLGGIVNIVLGAFIPLLHIHNATVGCGDGGGAPEAAPPAPTEGEPAPAE